MRHAPAVAVLVLLSACGRCGRPAGPPPERFLPAAVAGALLVPRLDAAQDALRPAVRTALTFPALADLSDTLASLGAQIGFDPLDARGAAQAGLDPSRGAALAFDGAGAPLLALPASDVGKLEALVARLARDRLGAAHAEA
ncbi:MAG TPA: hypothetical protein VFP65_06845, partial [Anaeromyxobacteraceae bacterium]|nr:hypothetical protein [Anaeromyxobacteraceae bacterium]